MTDTDTRSTGAGAGPIGWIEALYRYPVKSMRGEAVDAVDLTWYGVDGDRRLALRRVGERGGFPWLTAGKCPDLVRYAPDRDAAADGVLPSHVRTPEGERLPAFDEALAAEIGRRAGMAVEMMRLDQGIFDDASLSVIAVGTVREVCRLADVTVDARRFRPNVVVRTARGMPFEEDAWVSGRLSFGDGDDAAVATVLKPDIRCAMVNLDPDGGPPSPAVLKAVVQANENRAGIYASVSRIGRLAVGQAVWLAR